MNKLWLKLCQAQVKVRVRFRVLLLSFSDPDLYDGWLEKVKLKLTSAKFEVEAELGNNS